MKLYEIWPTHLGTNEKNYIFTSSAISTFFSKVESHNKMDYSKSTVNTLKTMRFTKILVCVFI